MKTASAQWPVPSCGAGFGKSPASGLPRLPLLFALDAKLGVADGFTYVADCRGLRKQGEAGTDAFQVYCAGDGVGDGAGGGGCGGDGCGGD